MPKQKSQVWSYFERTTRDGKHCSICKSCGLPLSGYVACNARRHLLSCAPDVGARVEQEDKKAKKPSQITQMLDSVSRLLTTRNRLRKEHSETNADSADSDLYVLGNLTSRRCAALQHFTPVKPRITCLRGKQAGSKTTRREQNKVNARRFRERNRLLPQVLKKLEAEIEVLGGAHSADYGNDFARTDNVISALHKTARFEINGAYNRDALQGERDGKAAATANMLIGTLAASINDHSITTTFFGRSPDGATSCLVGARDRTSVIRLILCCEANMTIQLSTDDAVCVNAIKYAVQIHTGFVLAHHNTMSLFAPTCTMFPFLVKPFANRVKCEFVAESQLLLVQHILGCVPPWQLLEAAKVASYLDTSERLKQFYLALCEFVGRQYDQVTGFINWRALYTTYGNAWHEDTVENELNEVCGASYFREYVAYRKNIMVTVNLTPHSECSDEIVLDVLLHASGDDVDPRFYVACGKMFPRMAEVFKSNSGPWSQSVDGRSLPCRRSHNRLTKPKLQSENEVSSRVVQIGGQCTYNPVTGFMRHCKEAPTYLQVFPDTPKRGIFDKVTVSMEKFHEENIRIFQETGLKLTIEDHMHCVRARTMEFVDFECTPYTNNEIGSVRSLIASSICVETLKLNFPCTTELVAYMNCSIFLPKSAYVQVLTVTSLDCQILASLLRHLPTGFFESTSVNNIVTHICSDAVSDAHFIVVAIYESFVSARSLPRLHVELTRSTFDAAEVNRLLTQKNREQIISPTGYVIDMPKGRHCVDLTESGGSWSIYATITPLD